MHIIQVMQLNKKLIQAIRKGNTHYFYTSWAWLQKRKQILERDNFECQRCKEEGGFSKANTVHHIKELKDYPELSLTDSNLVSLCYSCHNIAHERFEGQKPKIDIPERW